MRNNKYYIYKLHDVDNNCLYVGKTNNLRTRFSQHRRDKAWWQDVFRIETALCPKSFMIDLYEIYYINTLTPKYNIKDINMKIFNFAYPELKFTTFRGII